MPNQTANFALPYPNGSDDPCDFAQQWCDFTTAVNAVLNGFQETIDRTVPVIPTAQLRATTAHSYNRTQTTLVDFDAVAFDTAAWIDFDANSKAITIDRGGPMDYWGAVIVDPDGVNSIWHIGFTEVLLANGLDTLVAQQGVLDRGVGGTRVGNMLSDLETHLLPFHLYLDFFGDAVTHNITNAYLTAWWHADTVRPS